MTKLFALIGSLVALTAMGGCIFYWVDEVEMPESLL